MKADATQGPKQATEGILKGETVRALGRFLRYLVIRSIVVFLTVVIGIYAAIWVINIGGYADEQRRDQVRAAVGLSFRADMTLSPEERWVALQEAQEAAIQAIDLYEPFYLRSLRYWRQAFTLSITRPRVVWNIFSSTKVIDILMERLPMTLLLFGTASLISFAGGLLIGSFLSRRHGSFVDRAVTLLVPALSGPPWFYGLILIVIFASIAKLLPFGGVVDVPIPETTFGYILSVMKHMILPVSASVLGTLPYSVYTNRALFLVRSTEDYVEFARAKGLGPSKLHRRYILRPVLPAIITNFALIAFVSWETVILTESIFAWPGLGALVIKAIQVNDFAVVAGAVTMLAYLLGFTVLFLDIAYALVDPRVRLGGGGRK